MTKLKPCDLGEKLWINPRLYNTNSKIIINVIHNYKKNKYYYSTCIISHIHYLFKKKVNKTNDYLKKLLIIDNIMQNVI
jgi:hypothetical protein